MKKFSSVVLILFLSLVSGAYAAPVVPDQVVSITPVDAKVGDVITIKALVYNNTTTDTTFLISFTTTEKDRIGGQSLLVPAQSARTASVSWKMPVNTTIVTATVSQAIDVNKNEVKSLEGVIGTITAGQATPVITKAEVSSWTSAVTDWVNTFFAKLEIWRKKEAVHFAAVRDAAKVRLGIIPASTATTEPVVEPAKNTPVTSNDTTPASTAVGHPMDYVSYIVCMSVASFFSNQFFFYIGIALVAFLLVRFLFRLVF